MLIDSLQDIINDSPELLVCQIRNQVMAIVHRLDHYYYVNRYTMSRRLQHKKRTVATGVYLNDRLFAGINQDKLTKKLSSF